MFFFNDTATTEIYTLSLHDALPISSTPVADAPFPAAFSALILPWRAATRSSCCRTAASVAGSAGSGTSVQPERSEEHTSELQSRQYLVCRLLLEKKKTAEYRFATD